MPRLTLVLAVLVCGAAHAGITFMDAAVVDALGNPLDAPYVRLSVDNTGGERMHDVSFVVLPHGLTSWLTAGGKPVEVAWTDAANPWYGAQIPMIVGDTFEYTATFSTWLGGYIKPAFYIEYHEGHPLWNPPPDDWAHGVDLWDDIANGHSDVDSVPAGLTWDFVFRCPEGLELFSVAEGVLEADGIQTSLYDADPTPQTAPEPASLLLLATASLVFGARRYGRA